MKILDFFNSARVKLREETNPYLSKFRLRKLKRSDVSIISNNCWGGHVYRYLGINYLSPTVGLYFYAEDYVKFCANLRHYIETELHFITIDQSKYKDDLKANKKSCPIGVLDDVEIVFLHYKSEQEAFEKWNRRKNRIVWDNIVFKMSEQNLCKPEHIKTFDTLTEKRKICFVTEDYGVNSQILWGGPCEKGNIANDTILFREYVDPIKLINGEKCCRKQRKARRRLGLE